MRMNKIVLWSLILVFVLGINIALADEQPEGTPFKAIWNAIANLQTQINNIQLTPGPQGPAGPNLKVVDVSGMEVGYLISYTGTLQDPKLRTYNKELDLFLDYKIASGEFDSRVLSDVIYYATTDCTGTPYLPYFSQYLFLTKYPSSDEQIILKPNHYVEDIHFSSAALNDVCVETDEEYSLAMSLVEFIPINYEGPLRIVEQ